MREELRRKPRVKVCCRAIVRDRYGVWTGVTEDVGESGCRILSPRMLRAGTCVSVTLSSDLFPEELEVVGRAAWATSDRVAVKFSADALAGGRLTPAEFIAKVLEHGRTTSRTNLVPVLRAGPGVPTPLPQLEPVRPVALVSAGSDGAEQVPFRIPASRA